MMQDDQKGCKNNIRAEKEQITAARTKQHEDKEEDTGIRPAGREKIREQREKHGKKNKTSKTTSVIAIAFAVPPLNPTKTKTTTHCRVQGYSSTRSTY